MTRSVILAPRLAIWENVLQLSWSNFPILLWEISLKFHKGLSLLFRKLHNPDVYHIVPNFLNKLFQVSGKSFPNYLEENFLVFWLKLIWQYSLSAYWEKLFQSSGKKKKTKFFQDSKGMFSRNSRKKSPNVLKWLYQSLPKLPITGENLFHQLPGGGVCAWLPRSMVTLKHLS